MRRLRIFQPGVWWFRRRHILRRIAYWRPVILLVLLLGLIIGASDRRDLVDAAWRTIGGAGWTEPVEMAKRALGGGSRGDARIVCAYPTIIDGDTLHCGGHRIRLAGIDAPEMPGHCRPGRRCTPGDPHAAKAYLHSVARGQVVCRRTDTDHYGRTVARCESGGQDLSCAMISAGHAVRRYGFISCLF